MQQFTVRRKRDRNRLVAVPVALLGFLLIQLTLLPAHWMPAHGAAMSNAPPSVEHPAGPTSHAGGEHASHEHATHPAGPTSHTAGEHATHEHGPSDGEPVCHAAPHFADVIPNRAGHDDLTKLGPGVLLVLTAGVLALSPSLPRLPSRHWRWSPRPHWRPAGAALLTHVCIART